MYNEIKVEPIVSWFFRHFPHVFKSKSEIRHLLRQNGLTIYMTSGQWKPSENAGMVYDVNNNFIGVLGDRILFQNLHKHLIKKS
jgi:hypothetical protein